MATPQTAPSEAPDTFDPVPFSRDEPGTIFLLTSLTSGSSAIITATARLEHVLKSHKIAFKAVDLATDEKARRLWKWKGNGRRLPGVAKDGEVLGNFEEIDDWNEHGELRQMLGVSKKKKKTAGRMDGTTVPPNPSRTATPNVVQDREPGPSGPAGAVPTVFQQASVASAAAAAGKRKAAGIKSAVGKVEGKKAAVKAQEIAKTEAPTTDGASDAPAAENETTAAKKEEAVELGTKDGTELETRAVAETEGSPVADAPKDEGEPAEEEKGETVVKAAPAADPKSPREKTAEKKKTAGATANSPEKKKTTAATAVSHGNKRTPASTVGSPEKKRLASKEASAGDKSKNSTRSSSRPSTATRASSKPPASTSSRSSSRAPIAKDPAADKAKGPARSSSRPPTATRSSSRPPAATRSSSRPATVTTSSQPSTAKDTAATNKSKTAAKSPSKSDTTAKSMSSRPSSAKSTTAASSRPRTAKSSKPSPDKAVAVEAKEAPADTAATPPLPSPPAKEMEQIIDADIGEDRISALKASVEELDLQDEKDELLSGDEGTKTPTQTPVAE